jgi:nicotinic acid mononucleotide adenylyltransferase
MYRPGFEKPDFLRFTELWGSVRVMKLQENIIETPLIDISSTDIRAKIAQGKDVSEMLDANVAEYIKKNSLYKM